MPSRPSSTLTGWATSGTATAPSAGLIVAGWTALLTIPSAIFNYCFKFWTDWTNYFKTVATGTAFIYDSPRGVVLNTFAYGYVVNDSATAVPTSYFENPPSVGYKTTVGTAHLWYPIDPLQFFDGAHPIVFDSFYGTTLSSDSGNTIVSYTFFSVPMDASGVATPIATVTNDGTGGATWVQDAPTDLSTTYNPALAYGIRVTITGTVGGNALFLGVVLRMSSPGPV